MAKPHVSIAAFLALVPLVLAGCGTSTSQESGSTNTDRSAVNNSAAGFEDFFDNNPTGENVLSILGAGYPDALPTCNDSGISKNVMLIANTTNTPQTLSVTINPGLQEEAAFWPQYSGTLTETGCAGYGELPSTQTLTVPPGQTAVALLQSGGGTRNLIETSRNIAIGAGGQQWYDFGLDLSPSEGFEALALNYTNTGGTDPSQNLQPGLFNVMLCDTSSGGVAVTNSIVTQYNGDGIPQQELDELGEGVVPDAALQEAAGETNSPLPPGFLYGENQPICFAFIGEGANAYVPPAPAAAASATAPVTTPTDISTPAPTPTPVTTPTNSSTPTPTPTSTIAEWNSQAAYKIGDLVTYQGATYRCTESYQGYGDPSYILAPDLWEKVS